MDHCIVSERPICDLRVAIFELAISRMHELQSMGALSLEAFHVADALQYFIQQKKCNYGYWTVYPAYTACGR